MYLFFDSTVNKLLSLSTDMRLLSTLLIVLILAGVSSGRLITDSSSDLVSDGVHDGLRSQPLLRLNPLRASDACVQTYNFLPCTTTALGNLFLIVVYGGLMFMAAKSISTGSELLLEILGPGIIGGLFLPILGALPDAMLILGTNLRSDLNSILISLFLFAA